MKRLCYLGYLVLLMAVGSSAEAGNSLSFTVGGHRIRIEAPRHCYSRSCVSVSIPGIYQGHRWRDRFDDDERDLADQAKAPVAAPPPATPAQAVPPQGNPPVAAAPPPAVFKPAAATAQEVAAPPPAVALPKLPPLPPLPPPAIKPPAERPAEAVRPPPVMAPQNVKVSQQVDDDPADAPIGDWRSEGNKGTVRIERCGRALCGYALKASSDDKGEAVLINMKPKTEQQWTGNVVSHDSGATYYGTMAVKGPNELRVEACALGRFYCTGNVWTRIDMKPEKLITSRQAPERRS